ncbi:hypothetical protein GJU39_22225 [Pedobacter petrophilus]|uniref:Nucleotidyltransferase AbiEii toxin of type IV toxin-antitoxin system n=2 Tax=Pedobacter TaxID=84567 RepID=A0A497Y9S3_9SPHI|nr:MULTISPECIES: nucleotidyl transferase AbiEii/AbiGii toxin family protein [Pedobacter]MRX78797.1 hypothetical protein [Pedobacter petrophilus]RLJ79478.1 nucleotidyltransferase AbiEii toxin of type IV toxin-antitoxin system [Pedobacter alluvionis]TFB30826.1 hypothetical protein E3V97_09310 [Pedobacter alluvionis]
MLNRYILEPVISEMLAVLQEVFSKFEIDFYLVGAVARDINLSVNQELASTRMTKDVDLAITINDQGQYNRIKSELVSTGLFEVHESEAIKLFYKGAVELDLLPFGKIEEPDGNVKLTDPTFVLHMPGFTEIYPFVQDVELTDGQRIKVCSMEGIIMLKLLANDDRPQRTKDISDIEHIIQSYFDLYDGDIYEHHFDVMEMYDTNERDYIQLVCARVIGRKMHLMLKDSPKLLERISGILTKRPTPRWSAMLDGLNENT